MSRYESLKRDSKQNLIEKLKKLRYKNLARKNKEELIKMLIFDRILKPLQRMMRKSYIDYSDGIDPISCDPLVYPLWNKKCNGNRKYYNLETVITYLITNGRSAKDPIIREEYSNEEISQLNYLYKYYEYHKKFTYKSLLIPLKNEDRYIQLTYEDERVEVLKDYILTTLEDTMEEFILYYTKSTDYDDDEIKYIIIMTLKDLYNYFYWLFPLSKYWFNATFKLIYEKIRLNIRLGKYPPRDHFLYDSIYNTIRGIKKLCIDNHNESN